VASFTHRIFPPSLPSCNHPNGLSSGIFYYSAPTFLPTGYLLAPSPRFICFAVQNVSRLAPEGVNVGHNHWRDRERWTDSPWCKTPCKYERMGLTSPTEQMNSTRQGSRNFAASGASRRSDNGSGPAPSSGTSSSSRVFRRPPLCTNFLSTTSTKPKADRGRTEEEVDPGMDNVWLKIPMLWMVFVPVSLCSGILPLLGLNSIFLRVTHIDGLERMRT
jgi:hypothetical protein